MAQRLAAALGRARQRVRSRTHRSARQPSPVPRQATATKASGCEEPMYLAVCTDRAGACSGASGCCCGCQPWIYAGISASCVAPGSSASSPWLPSPYAASLRTTSKAPDGWGTGPYSSLPAADTDDPSWSARHTSPCVSPSGLLPSTYRSEQRGPPLLDREGAKILKSECAGARRWGSLWETPVPWEAFGPMTILCADHNETGLHDRGIARPTSPLCRSLRTGPHDRYAHRP